MTSRAVTASPDAAASLAGGRWRVFVLCWLVVVFDGYDLIVYGATLPRLLDEPGWGLNPATAGTIGSLAFLGMLIGALGAGWLSDRIGRRWTVIASTALFSAATAACAFAPSPEVFGALRLLAGLGLGGVVPSANALTAEFTARGQRAMVATLMMSGIPIGGSIAALIGIPILPAYGWRPMYAFALLGLLVIVPLLIALLPESPTFRQARAARTAQPGNRDGAEEGLFAPRWRRASILYAAATLATLFSWYGLGTWLPQLMRQTGFDLGSALSFTLALNLGAVAGSLFTGYAGGRVGPRRVAIVAAAVAGVALALLLTAPGTLLSYLIFVLAGVGTHGTQCLTIAAIANHYPDNLRGRALGWSLGVGRIGAVAAPQLGGLLLAAGLGVNSNFVVFAVAAGLAAALLWLCPRDRISAPASETADAPPRPRSTSEAEKTARPLSERTSP